MHLFLNLLYFHISTVCPQYQSASQSIVSIICCPPFNSVVSISVTGIRICCHVATCHTLHPTAQTTRNTPREKFSNQFSGNFVLFISETNIMPVSVKSNEKTKSSRVVPTLEMKLKITANFETGNIQLILDMNKEYCLQQSEQM